MPFFGFFFGRFKNGPFFIKAWTVVFEIVMFAIEYNITNSVLCIECELGSWHQFMCSYSSVETPHYKYVIHFENKQM